LAAQHNDQGRGEGKKLMPIGAEAQSAISLWSGGGAKRGRGARRNFVGTRRLEPFYTGEGGDGAPYGGYLDDALKE